MRVGVIERGVKSETAGQKQNERKSDNRKKTKWQIARAWDGKSGGEREKERIVKERGKKLGDGKGERGSSEYLMGSGGVYWSTRQCRLFHLVIQLFRHLADVVSSCEGLGRTLRPPTQSRRVALEKHESYGSMGERESGAGLQTGKREGFSGFRCVCIHPSPYRSNLEVVAFSLLHAFSIFASHFLAPRIHVTGKHMCI